MPYLSHTWPEREEMLKAIGVSSMERLLEDIPEKIRLKRDLHLPVESSEMEVSFLLKEIASQNQPISSVTSFIGGGIYDRYVPSVVDHLAGRSEFYTAYTPYQPEISQGTLQAVFEFQTMICMLTGMEVANASLYDGATAMAEGALMACQITGRKEVLVAKTVHPIYRQVLRTYLTDLQISINEVADEDGVTSFEALKNHLSNTTAVLIMQNPNFFGSVEELQKFSSVAHEQGALALAVVEPISLGMLKPPGEVDVDIVVGEGQGLGNYLNFGGPYLGFIATKEKYMRRLPGRIVGQTEDREGKRGFVLTLQTREQHIRREKATSNICSNEALCALRATIYLSLLGKEGFYELAALCLQKTHYLAQQIKTKTKFKLAFSSSFFQEFVVQCPRPAQDVLQELRKRKLLGGIALGHYYPELNDHLLITVTEKRTREELDRLVEGLVALS